MSDNNDNYNDKLLATIDNIGTSTDIFPSKWKDITDKDLVDYTIEELKAKHKKQPRIHDRPADENYTPPLGLFNLGDNALYFDKDEELRNEENDSGDQEDEVKEVNHYKMVNGRLIYTEEEQPPLEDQEKENKNFQMAVKNDIPFLIYTRIRDFGRMTIDELYTQFSALNPKMFKIIVNDMVNKKYLKQTKDIDKIIDFDKKPTEDELNNFDVKTYINNRIYEKELDTLEIVGEKERKLVLEDKSSSS